MVQHRKKKTTENTENIGTKAKTPKHKTKKKHN